MIYVEPVFSKAGDRIGVNYMGMDVTDQVSILSKFKLFLSSVFWFLWSSYAVLVLN